MKYLFFKYIFVRKIFQFLNKLLKFHRGYRNNLGKLHCVNGPAIIRTFPYYFEEWWIDGKRHRVGGPAVTYDDGSEDWLQNGKLHRVDGFAIVRNDTGFDLFSMYNYYNEQARFGKTTNQYFYKVKFIKAPSLEEFKRKIKLIAFL
jgi:hypothetical protein